jgi:inward rectifier potassium channel
MLRGGCKLRRPRRQTIDLNRAKAVKIGMPHPLDDLYYQLMQISWPAFIGMVSGMFLFINLVFAIAYVALGGGISNATPGSLSDAFFFSVETLATVGYGSMAPITFAARSIAMVEILIGLFFSATVTGLIFARFARPREGLIFSRVAVIDDYEGKPALVLRMGSTRLRPIVDVTAQLSWLERVDLPDGRSSRRLVELPLVRSINPRLDLSWTLVHLIGDDSALIKALAGDGVFMLTLNVTGLDTLLASVSQGSTTYRRDDILDGHRFVDIITLGADDLTLDLTKLHDTVPHEHRAADAVTSE